jgi:hypothetical protein
MILIIILLIVYIYISLDWFLCQLTMNWHLRKVYNQGFINS